MSTLSQFVGGKVKAQEFNSSGTFAVPAGVNVVYVTMCGGGGSGGNDAGNGASGGGSGCYNVQMPWPVTPSTNVTVTIGGGGGAQASNDTAGNDGGSTSFGNLTASGGSGGRRAGIQYNAANYTGDSPSPGGQIGGVGGGAGNSTDPRYLMIGYGMGGKSGRTQIGLPNGNYPRGYGGGGGGLFGDGTAGALPGTNNSTNAAASNSGAGSGGASNGGSGAGGSGKVIVEYLA